MRTSKFFIATQKEVPAEAEIVSHRLMLRAGMMRQEAAGIYAFLYLHLPLEPLPSAPAFPPPPAARQDPR